MVLCANFIELSLSVRMMMGLEATANNSVMNVLKYIACLQASARDTYSAFVDSAKIQNRCMNVGPPRLFP